MRRILGATAVALAMTIGSALTASAGTIGIDATGRVLETPLFERRLHRRNPCSGGGSEGPSRPPPTI